METKGKERRKLLDGGSSIIEVSTLVQVTKQKEEGENHYGRKSGKEDSKWEKKSRDMKQSKSHFRGGEKNTNEQRKEGKHSKARRKKSHG